MVKEAENVLPMQVCWEINTEDTFLREIKALTMALDELKLSNGLLITLDNTIPYVIEDTRIKQIPASEWLLRV